MWYNGQAEYSSIERFNTGGGGGGGRDEHELRINGTRRVCVYTHIQLYLYATLMNWYRYQVPQQKDLITGSLLKCIDPNPRAYFQNNSLDCRIFKHTVATAPTRATPTLGKCLAPMCTFLLLLHT